MIKTQRYCSPLCRKRASNVRISEGKLQQRQIKYADRICVICDVPVPVTRKHSAVTCSVVCGKTLCSRPQTYGPCIFGHCDGLAATRPDGDGETRGLCGAHGRQQLRGKALTLVKRYNSTEGICEYEDCSRFIFAMRYCETHYGQLKKGRVMISLDPQKRRLRTVGARNVKEGGYIRVKTMDGWEYEHRLAMMQQIGRSLFAHETIHHLNGIRDDNRIENLELWSTSQPKGQRVQDKVEWAASFLAEYGLSVTGQMPLL